MATYSGISYSPSSDYCVISGTVSGLSVARFSYRIRYNVRISGYGYDYYSNSHAGASNFTATGTITGLDPGTSYSGTWTLQYYDPDTGDWSDGGVSGSISFSTISTHTLRFRRYGSGLTRYTISVDDIEYQVNDTYPTITIYDVPEDAFVYVYDWVIQSHYSTPIMYYNLPSQMYFTTANEYALSGTYQIIGDVSYDRYIQIGVTEDQKYYVSYNANGGSGTLPATHGTYAGSTLTLGSASRLTHNPRTTTAQTAYGVICDYNYTGSEVKSGTVYTDYSIEQVCSKWKIGQNLYWQGGSYTMGTTDVVAYAYWEDGTATVTDRRDTGITLPTITRTGFTFDGWYTASTGGTRIGGGGDTYYAGGSTTIYAHWTQNAYTITFDKQGGTGGTSSINATYGQMVPNITPPTKSGNTFLGYFDSGNYQYYSSAGVGLMVYNLPYGTTLYAHWQASIGKFWWDGGTGSTDSSIIYVDGPVSNLTANMWNRLNAKIKEVNPNYTYTTISSGDTFTAALFNQARNGIDGLSGHGNLPSTVSQGGTIYATYFTSTTSLRDALNTAIDNL